MEWTLPVIAHAKVLIPAKTVKAVRLTEPRASCCMAKSHERALRKSATQTGHDLAGKYALSREDQASIPADEAERMAKELLDIFAVVCDPRAFRSLGWHDWGVRTA